MIMMSMNLKIYDCIFLTVKWNLLFHLPLDKWVINKIIYPWFVLNCDEKLKEEISYIQKLILF